MAVILRKAWQGYLLVFDELTGICIFIRLTLLVYRSEVGAKYTYTADPRTNEWPLVAKPYQGLLLLGLYLMFLLKWGPEWMKNRKPFNIKVPLIIYNLLQVAINMCLAILAFKYAWGWNSPYRWVCEPVDYSYHPDALFVAKVTYVYFLTKIIDLLDTVFFVLRKKNNQISFLHIYHHTGMVLLIWAAITYYPGGHGTLVGQINSIVHVVMYFYYFLTVAFPSTKQALWLKKLVTQLQIVQFLCFSIHMSTLVFKTDCDYPRWIAAVFLPQNLFMLVMFTDFYIKTYIKKPKQKIAVSNNTKTVNGKSTQILNGDNKNKEVNSINNNSSNKYVNNEDNTTETSCKNDNNCVRNGQNGSNVSVYENIKYKNSTWNLNGKE